MKRITLVVGSISGLVMAAAGLLVSHSATSQQLAPRTNLRLTADRYTPVGSGISANNVGNAWFVVVTDTEQYPVSCHAAVTATPVTVTCVRGVFPK